MITAEAYNLLCLDIPADQNYWFIRTQDGKWFDEFLAGSYVAIGWNKITPETIKKLEHRKKLQEYISKHFSKEGRHGLTVTHMIRFIMEMKIGDIVVIPSKSSGRFAFGQITSDVYS